MMLLQGFYKAVTKLSGTVYQVFRRLLPGVYKAFRGFFHKVSSQGFFTRLLQGFRKAFTRL
jgi:hypothetical protein